MDFRLPKAGEAELSYAETWALLNGLNLAGPHLEWRERMTGESSRSVPVSHAGYRVTACSVCSRPVIASRNQWEQECGRHSAGAVR